MNWYKKNKKESIDKFSYSLRQSIAEYLNKNKEEIDIIDCSESEKRKYLIKLKVLYNNNEFIIYLNIDYNNEISINIEVYAWNENMKDDDSYLLKNTNIKDNLLVKKYNNKQCQMHFVESSNYLNDFEESAKKIKEIIVKFCK